MKKLILLATLLILTFSLGGADSDIPIFKDDFSTYQTFAENWMPANAKTKYTTSKGRLIVEGTAVLKLRRDVPDNFSAEYDVVFDGKNNGYAGFATSEKKFHINSNGYAKGWMGAQVPSFEYGNPVTIKLIRRLSGNAVEYIFLANGKLMKRELIQNRKIPNKTAGASAVDAADGIEKEMDGIMASATETKQSESLALEVSNVSISKFRLYALGGKNQSANMVPNSSFEFTDEDGMPPYFVQNASSYDFVSRKIPFEKFLSNLRSVDTCEKFNGKQSLRMTFEEGMTRQYLWFQGVGMVHGPTVFSIYMKASENDFPVNLSLGRIKQEFKISTEWKRYIIKNPDIGKDKGESGIGLSFDKKCGTLWIDALQVESGEEATDYRPSSMDELLFPVPQKIVRPTMLQVQKVKSGIKPDARLDLWKDSGMMTDKFTSSALKGSVWLACDDEAFYVGIRTNAENAFVFFDPQQAGNFNELSFNSKNEQYPDVVMESLRTEAGKDFFAKIPLKHFSAALLKNEWYFNIGLTDGKLSGRASLASDGMFKSVDSCPVIALPEEIVKRYKLGTECETAKIADRTFLRINSTNMTGSLRKGSFELPEYNKKLQVELKKGTSDATISLESVKSPFRLIFRDENGFVRSDRLLKAQEKPFLSTLGRLNYYMSEENAVYRVRTFAADASALKARLELCGKQLECPVSENFDIVFPLKDISDGIYEGSVSITENGKTIATAPVRLVKRPHIANATQINHFSRSLIVDGKPYFPFSPFEVTYNDHRGSEKAMNAYVDFFHEYGFRSLDTLTWGIGDNGDDYKGLQAQLRRMEKHGMKLMMWQGFMNKKGQVSDAHIERMIKASTSPSIITWRVLDEPEIGGMSSETAEKHLLSMRKWFPYQPVYMNNTFLGIPRNYANLNTEILMVDDYLTNRPNRTVESVIDNADVMWKKGIPNARPCFFFLVGCNVPNHYRELSGSEQIAQTYGAIAAGCTGLSYFYGTPAALGHWKAYIQLNKEIIALNDVICSEETVSPVQSTGNEKLLRFTVKKHDGYVYVISCNIDRRTADGITFTLPSDLAYDGAVEVMFENRRIDLKDGQFTDGFPGYSRHVYKIKIK